MAAGFRFNNESIAPTWLRLSRLLGWPECIVRALWVSTLNETFTEQHGFVMIIVRKHHFHNRLRIESTVVTSDSVGTFSALCLITRAGAVDFIPTVYGSQLSFVLISDLRAGTELFPMSKSYLSVGLARPNNPEDESQELI